MNRDTELVRKILLHLESQDDFRNELKMPEENPISVAYHLKIMEQAGLVEQKVHYADDKPMWMHASITWDGQEFLKAIKNENVWSKLIKKIKEEGGNLPFAVITKLALKYSEQLFL